MATGQVSAIANNPAAAAHGQRLRLNSGLIGAVMLAVIALPCLITLPWSLPQMDHQQLGDSGTDPRRPPSLTEPFGTDALGRSLLWRCLAGGAVSLSVGLAAALLSVLIGVSWGTLAGYLGGSIDAAMMRFVDVLYGLPYILLVVMLNLALLPPLEALITSFMPLAAGQQLAGLLCLMLAIGGVSWLTMARVIRGQVLSLRSQPFIEATHAIGMSTPRIIVRHLLPNLVGPIVVYATLTVPQAILQESFLSFLGIGVRPPLPSWGNLAADGVQQLGVIALIDRPDLSLHAFTSNPGQWVDNFAGMIGEIIERIRWWLLLYPCLLLGLTLMALNFLGDDLRDRLDPRGKRRH